MDNKKHTIGQLLHYLLTAAAEDACAAKLLCYLVPDKEQIARLLSDGMARPYAEQGAAVKETVKY